MSAQELRLGVVGLDGHGPVFIEQLNGAKPALEGTRVVVAMPYPSIMASPEKLSENVEAVKGFGVAVVEDPQDLADRVDGILILHDDGSKHLELAEKFADKGRPVFIDKPVEASAGRVKEIIEVCGRMRCPVFSASSLRFSVEMQAVQSSASGGNILSAMTYSPYMQAPSMPGWIYYGIHAVEPLFQLMGSGCREVRCINSKYGPLASGVWSDGRVGIARAGTGGHHGYGFTVWKEKETVVKAVDIDLIYAELLKKVKQFFETGVPPVSLKDSLEAIAFMEAANKSMAEGGSLVELRI
jgi:predicted dehydrogenase